jgi:hypothetical protein
VDWTVSYLNEGNPEITGRNGLASQLWLVNHFSLFQGKDTEVGVCGGPYDYVDKKNPVPAGTGTTPKFAALTSFTVSQPLTGHWLARLTFSRVTSNYNRDADIFLGGVGCRWPI